MSYEEESPLDDIDRKLHRFFEKNVPITDSKTLNALHERYKGSGTKRGFRGLLFHKKEQLDRFVNSLKSDGGYASSSPSSISLSRNVAHSFSVTTPSYDDVDSYRESAAGLRRGEWVSGYEGVLIELEFEGADCIDLSLAGLCAENELLLMPNAGARVVSIIHNVPYHRQFSEGLVTIDDIVRKGSDLSDPRVNFIIENLTDQLSPSQCETLFEMADDRQEIKTSLNVERFLGQEVDVFERAASLNEVICVSKVDKKNGEDRQYSVYVHPNGFSVREFVSSQYENYKLVENTYLVTDFMVPSLQVDLVEKLEELDQEVFGETCQVLRAKLTSHCNRICEAILDSSELKQFKGQEIHPQLASDLKSYASPVYLEALREAIHPNRGQRMRELNDKSFEVRNKQQLSKHTDEVNVAMSKLLDAISIGKPTSPKP
ncbi:hypothetical protein KW882_04105 [Vibrio parahaemolyticus]